MVEAAIVLPLFLVLMFGIMELGIVLYDKAVITNAGREAARSGVALVNPKLTNTQIAQVARDYCSNNLINFNAANLAVTVTPPTTPTTFGAQIKVAVTYNYYNIVFGSVLALLPGGAFPNPLALSATTTMNNE